MTIGLKPGRFYRGAELRCLNLLLTYEDGCRGRCSYCGLAQERLVPSSGRTFIRVRWPVYPLETVLRQVENHPHSLERVCISMLTHPKALQDTVELVRRFKGETDLSISALVAPSAMADLEGSLTAIKDAGADRCGIAIDAATPQLFARHRGEGVKGPHRWERFWQAVETAVQVFGPFKVGIHLIVGLGESEEEMVRVIQEAQDQGAHTHLFSFFPEPGSALAAHLQPPLGQYRRIQLARYLINERGHTAQKMTFSEGKITDFGYPDLAEVIEEGEAFLTSGCPGKTCRYACNRPYGNERPSEAIRNFPFPPEPSDIAEIKEQLAW
ncbi:MAG: radical SAM protein [Firmicutes bacterium]|nr:radical SAM protein [Bacillota bacterium]